MVASMNNDINQKDRWRAVDITTPVTTLAPALLAIAGGPGPEAAGIRAALSGGSGAAGGYTLPNDMHDQFVAMVSRGMSAVQAGARVIQLKHDDLTIPRVLTGPTPAWRLEGGAVAEADPTFEAATLTPRSLSLLVKVSRELLADGFEIERVLTQTIGAGVAAELDRITWRGTGTAPEPLGLFARPLVPYTGETPTEMSDWRQLNSAFWALQKGRPYPVEANAIVTSANVAEAMDGMTGADAQMCPPPKGLGKLPRYVSQGMAPAAGDVANCYAAVIGDFRELLFGWRGDIRIELLSELYAGTGQVGFLVHARMGIELLNKWAFVALRQLKMSTVLR